jgi:hypothetical protein
MRLRGVMPAALALVCVAWFATPSQPAPTKTWKPPSLVPSPDSTAKPARPPVNWINDEPDTGQFLADTVLLARVEKREIRARGYLETYFASYAEYRPRPDSAGRLEFLNSMINKEVLGLTALSVNRPLGFEDRAVMREYTQRTLSNVLYQRAILDSVKVSEAELRRVYEQHKTALHLRHIVFATRSEAERVRADLIAKRITWKDAVRKYSIAPEEDRKRDGDIGVKSRFGFDPVMAFEVFALKPGQTSQVMNDSQGYQLVQCVESRPVAAPAYEDIRSGIMTEVRSQKIQERSERLRAIQRNEIGMVYDTTNIEWACRHFIPTLSAGMDGSQGTMEINTAMPEFAPADTSRVLARHRYGRFTLGAFLDGYTGISPLMRPTVNDFEGMRGQIDGMVLEPYMAELAIRRGLDRDSMAVGQIEGRREEILVEHLYADSISSKVWIKPEDRRKYYNDNIAGFITYPKVTFAGILRPSRGSADSLAARLRAGEKAADLLRADSLQGRNTGSIQERSANDHGSPYYKLLFEELRPGKLSVEGPDREGSYAVIQLLSYDPGHQLKYEEVEHIVDESLQNIKAEEMLKAFLVRRKKLYRIEAHPERLARLRMVDPSLLE